MLQHFLSAALVAAPLVASAGSVSSVFVPDTMGAVAPAPVPRVDPGNRRPWYLPSHVVLQTGGGLGMVAGGAGFTLKDRLELDVLVGYVPEKHAGSALSLASAKLLYSPWTLPIKDKWSVKPLTVGGYISYTHGTINDEKPNQYPKGYYWFSTDTRIGPVLGSRLSYALPPTASGYARNLSAYYELSTNDLYLVSYVQNRKSLSPADILVLSLGLKLDI